MEKEENCDGLMGEGEKRGEEDCDDDDGEILGGREASVDWLLNEMEILISLHFSMIENMSLTFYAKISCLKF